MFVVAAAVVMRILLDFAGVGSRLVPPTASPTPSIFHVITHIPVAGRLNCPQIEVSKLAFALFTVMPSYDADQTKTKMDESS
ncbi:MAG TPA: hypothetical protein PK988_12075, partial [Candidatus Sumerlaeota bacterium]|nr:hypothetical protein [Candidatus Sumerlaeota bacterium]